MNPGAIQDSANALRFLLAGNAHATFVSLETGVRFTFHVVLAKAKPGDTRPAPHFVSVLTGPDHYEFLGTIFGSKIYTHGRRSRIGENATSEKAFAWIWRKLSQGLPLDGCEVHHEGRCGRCGRRLTVPESILSGLGPECASKVAS
jgi:hypothetical protein